MARISFSALVEELVGKLAGSVFQDSYFGMQVRTRVSPRNPRSTYQQLRRGEFGFLSASWRNLTTTQRQTFIDAATTPPQALNLFLQSNINLTLINESIIDTYVPGPDPGSMTVELQSANNFAIVVQATGGTPVVPAGTKLLIYLTRQKPETRIFNSPSDYQPVIDFDEGTDLSVPQNIIAAWQSRYGQMTANGRIALRSRLIDKSNGLSGADNFSASIIEEGPEPTRFDVSPSGPGYACGIGTFIPSFNSGTIGVGFANYYDSGLQFPITGFSNFADLTNGLVFALNPATGVGTSLLGLCN